MAGKEFLDFALIKERVSMRDVVEWLQLRMKGTDQLRSPCPACRSGGDRALAVNLTKSSFYCFADGKGGDSIGLCAHIRGIGQREAAEEIAAHFKVGQTERQERDTPATTARPVGGMKSLDYIEYDHPAVEAVGFSPEVAEAVGLGYTGKGLMKGLVAVPLRLEDGTLIGYMGVSEARLPNQWHLPTSNVVPLQKKPA